MGTSAKNKKLITAQLPISTYTTVSFSAVVTRTGATISVSGASKIAHINKDINTREITPLQGVNAASSEGATPAKKDEVISP